MEYAISRQIPYGIWGGQTPREREVIVRPRRIPVGEIANNIIDLNERRFTATEIASRLNTSVGYVRKILSQYGATRKGEIQSHQEIKEDSSPSSESSL